MLVNFFLLKFIFIIKFRLLLLLIFDRHGIVIKQKSVVCEFFSPSSHNSK